MDRYVARDKDGKINAACTALQPGYAEELLPEDHPEVVAFLEPTKKPEPRTPAAAIVAYLKEDPQALADLKADLAK